MSKVIEMQKQGNTWTATGNRFGRTFAKVTAGVSALVASGLALAQDHSAEIEAAYTSGSTNVTAAVAGVIALVAIVVGLGLVVSILRR